MNNTVLPKPHVITPSGTAQRNVVSDETTEAYCRNLAIFRECADACLQVEDAFAVIDKHKDAYRRASMAVTEIHDLQQFLGQYPTWTAFCEKELSSFSRSAIHRMVRGGGIVNQMSHMWDILGGEGELPLPAVGRQTEILALLDYTLDQINVMVNATEQAQAEGKIAAQESHVREETNKVLQSRGKPIRSATRAHKPVTQSLAQFNAGVAAPQEEQENGTGIKITAQERPAQSHAEVEPERQQQAHLFAEECRKAARHYCKLMGYDLDFATQVYHSNLSAARNLEAKLQEGHDEANFRKGEASESMAGGAYICERCGATREEARTEVAVICGICQHEMSWGLTPQEEVSEDQQLMRGLEIEVAPDIRQAA